MPHSEVTYLRQRIQAEQDAAERGLHGLASGSARHDFIIRRMEMGAASLLQLIAEGKHEEVALLMNMPDWGLKTEGGACRTMTRM